ncbi:hypothetical protein Q4Q39_16015 [Flavivirga amylovorans]|uniref:HTH luxR-type domain-containing protein n=1 Tax=Flavivirga amylovorans TaxID=870486 RepID=A0ABT8X4K9_9FLAO|nr:hypothetical protein [Flavivirga amylovorans]MDO5988916.1 hypothetical protein [Flavivirga amylovorans]
MECSTIELTNTERYFLRLSVLNFDNKYIANFLSLRKKDLSNIKKALKIKFNTKDWVALIQKAFELGILKERDYVDSTVKKIALEYASKIINDSKGVPSGYKLPKSTLLDFDNTVTNTLKRMKIALK